MQQQGEFALNIKLYSHPVNRETHVNYMQQFSFNWKTNIVLVLLSRKTLALKLKLIDIIDFTISLANSLAQRPKLDLLVWAIEQFIVH